jgi:hypothetical protein
MRPNLLAALSTTVISSSLELPAPVLLAPSQQIILEIAIDRDYLLDDGCELKYGARVTKDERIDDPRTRMRPNFLAAPSTTAIPSSLELLALALLAPSRQVLLEIAFDGI